MNYYDEGWDRYQVWSGMPRSLTYPQVLGEIGTLVAERPNNIYQAPDIMRSANIPHINTTCFYVHIAAPGCIMGQWLHRFHGVSLETLVRFEGQGVTSMLSLGGTVREPGVVPFLQAVQKLQDSGKTWLEAFHAGVRRVEQHYITTSLKCRWGSHHD